MNAKETRHTFLKVAAVLAFVALSTRVLILANEVQQEPGAQFISRSIDNAHPAANIPVTHHSSSNSASAQETLTSI